MILRAGLKARGLVHCNAPNHSCKRHRQRMISCDMTEYPVLNIIYKGEAIAIVVTTKGGKYLRSVALGIATNKNPVFSCILSDGECADCCLAKVKDSNVRPALIIANVGNKDLGKST